MNSVIVIDKKTTVRIEDGHVVTVNGHDTHRRVGAPRSDVIRWAVDRGARIEEYDCGVNEWTTVN